MEKIFATERLKELLPKVKAFVESELLPLEKDHHTRTATETYTLLNAKRAGVRAAGLWGLHLPKNEGGWGLTLCEFAQLSEAMSRTPFYGQYAFNCQAPDIGNMELLSKFGSEGQKRKFLHPLLEGKIRSCFAMTEPEFAGSNPTRLATAAVKKGDNYVLNGHKWFTSSFEGASFMIVMAVTNPSAPPHQRASMIIVPTDTKGVIHIRKIPIFGEAGGDWASHSEIRLENCEVPVTNLIGEEGQGFKLAQERLGPGRIHHCMRWIGIAEKAFDLMCQRAASREIGQDTLLGEKQFIQGFIAESRVEIDAARLLVLRTAAKIDDEGAGACRNEISGIKFFTANMVLKVLDRAIQVHGALGLSDGTMLATLYQHERGARIWDGADEVHKQSLALGILKSYGLDVKKGK
ncbi:MAG: acyl-CoA dehydrogenase family protein [Cyclobacteriaceae bacterium]|nr:acyl-CoA dehydrogenase family protein [Cyclobacteriaceae bacterium]